MLQHSRKRSSKQLIDGSKCLKRVWKHKFFCLAHVDQFRVPTNEAEKDQVFDAGLGEKRLNLKASIYQQGALRTSYCNHFFSCVMWEGFKCANVSPILDRVRTPLKPCDGLNQRVGNARTYIIPLQNTLI